MKKIILFLVLVTQFAFGQFDGKKEGINAPSFWGLSGTSLIPTIPGTTVDTTYTNAVSKLNAGSGITVTKNAKDYTIAYTGAETSGGWTNLSGSNKIYNTITGDTVYIGSDTTGRGRLNVAGAINGISINGIVVQSVHGVYFMGNSLTHDPIYPTRVGTLLGAYWAVTNAGVNGNTTTQMLARFTTDITAHLDCEYVVILGGVNDAIADAYALTIINNLQAMYTAAHNANIKVVAVTILPFKASGTWSAGRQVVIDSVNTWLLNTATNVDYKVDAYSVLEDTGRPDYMLPANSSSDSLHLSTTGYTLLGTTVYNGATWTPRYDFTSGAYLTVMGDAKINQDVQTTGSPTFVNQTLSGYQTLKNQSALQSTITTDYSRVYPYDDGTTVRMFITKDNNAVETQTEMTTTDGWGMPKSVYYSGSSSYTSVANNAALNFDTSNFSISCWLTIDDVSSAQYIIAKNSTASYYLALGGDGKFVFNSGGVSTTATNVAVAGTTYFITYTKVATYRYLYINGLLDKLSVGATINSNNTATFNIGSASGNNLNFKGKIHLVHAFNFALTDIEQRLLWNNGRPDLAEIWYKYRWGSQTNLTTYDATGGDNLLNDSSTVVLGKSYRFVKGLSDSCSINGVKNIIISSTDTTFTATSTLFYAMGDLTGSRIIANGAVAEFKADNCGYASWQDNSTNNLWGTNVGVDIGTSPQHIKQYKLYTTSNPTLTQRRGYFLKQLVFQADTALTDIDLTQETSGLTPVLDKTCAAGITATFTASDHNVYATDKTLTFALTSTYGNYKGYYIAVFEKAVGY